MLIITDAAKSHIAEELGEPTEGESPVVRLVADADGFSLEIDTPGEGDQTHEHEGRPILVVAPDVAEQVDGMVLDAEETEEGTVLTLGEPEDEDEDEEPEGG